jgi:predicted DNA-binding protein
LERESIARIRYPEVVSVRLPLTTARKLREVAAADDRPPTVFARRLIERGLEDLSARPDPELTTAAARSRGR